MFLIYQLLSQVYAIVFFILFLIKLNQIKNFITDFFSQVLIIEILLYF